MPTGVNPRAWMNASSGCQAPAQEDRRAVGQTRRHNSHQHRARAPERVTLLVQVKRAARPSTYAAPHVTQVAGVIVVGSAVSGKNERTASRLDTGRRFRRLARQRRDAPPPVQAKRSPWVSVHRTSPFALRWPTSATDHGSSRRIPAPGASMPSGGNGSSIASGRPSNIRKIITSRATPPPPLRTWACIVPVAAVPVVQELVAIGAGPRTRRRRIVAPVAIAVRRRIFGPPCQAGPST